MAATFYHINTTLAADGAMHQSDYWPDGNGYDYPGYVTSMEQLRSELGDNLSTSKLRLYIITSSGDTKTLTTDDELKQAVESLPDRGILSVTAIARSNTRKSKNKNKKNKNKRRDTDEEWNAKQNTGNWYDDEYSTDDGDEYYYRQNDQDEDESDNENEDDTDYETSGALQIVTSVKKIDAIVERFDAASMVDGAECYHCDLTEWGNRKRYCYAMNTDYSMCSKCYKKLPKAQKNDWELTTVVRETTWEDDAPEYPLGRDEDHSVREEVRHLQYILTRIGCMPLSATKQLVGSYQSNTEKAVRRFRQIYGIRGGDMGVYNARTAKKMGEVVRQLREHGHKRIWCECDSVSVSESKSKRERAAHLTSFRCNNSSSSYYLDPPIVSTSHHSIPVNKQYCDAPSRTLHITPLANTSSAMAIHFKIKLSCLFNEK